ncbi:MAG: hypothetical protein ACO1OO_04790 [Flavisolibacter sp.]
MYLLIELTVIGFAVFIVTAVVFLLAVKFFIDSKRKLSQYMTPQPTQNIFIALKKPETPAATTIEKTITPTKKEKQPAATDLESMKAMLVQQQKELSRALEKISEVQKAPKADETDWEKRVAELHLTIEKRETEIRALRQQNELSREMQSHFDELQNEVDFLQEKLAKLEQQAWQANELAIKLESMEQTQLHLEKEVLRKDEKLRELTADNQRINQLLNTTEDKLQESNMMRSQLQKKIQFLEEMNNDMKQVSETNRRLQTEIRRIGELESMLNLIMEERDELLRQRSK